MSAGNKFPTIHFYKISDYGLPMSVLGFCFLHINPKFSCDMVVSADKIKWFGILDNGLYYPYPIPTLEEVLVAYEYYKTLNTTPVENTEPQNKIITKKIFDNNIDITTITQKSQGIEQSILKFPDNIWSTLFPDTQLSGESKINVLLGVISKLKYTTLPNFNYNEGYNTASRSFVILNKFPILGSEIVSKTIFVVSGQGTLQLCNESKNTVLKEIDFNTISDDIVIDNSSIDITEQCIGSIKIKAISGSITIHSIKFL